MPPRSISSAVALVGLCSLAAVETGACSNSPKSLASVTRSGLPLLSSLMRGPLGQLSLTKFSRAVTANNPESEIAEATAVLDHGFGPMSELQPHCGRYEFKDDGKLVVWDAFTSVRPAQALAIELGKRESALKWTLQSDGAQVANRRHQGRAQRLEIRAAGNARLPDNCRAMLHDVEAVLVVSESL